MTKKDREFIFKIKALGAADDKRLSEKTLASFIATYVDFYYRFWNLYSEKIKFYLSKDNEFLSEAMKEKLEKLLSFLKSGLNLYSKRKLVNKKEFSKYTTFNSQDELNEWNNFVDYAEKDLNLKGIWSLNYNLQFIVSFYNDEYIRQKFFFEMVKEVSEKEENEVENLLLKLFKDKKFGPKLNQNVYLKQIKQEM